MPDTEKVTMPKAHNRNVFNGEADDFYDSNFEINNKMKLPKTLRLNDEFTDDNSSSTNGLAWNQAISNDTFAMHMPDRILVVGHDQHMGVKAPPLEMTMENPESSPEHTLTRVQTPPKILTLGDHFFPTFDDDNGELEFPNHSDLNASLPVPSKPYVNESQIIRRAAREQTPVWNSNLDMSLAPSEEIQHLRRQVGKLNRRVMSVELEMVQRQQRDKIFYAITIAYFFFKAFNWLTRN
ncbi:hypothetical protein PV327_005970 [Microctonus hyperodae]|uniref:Mff-like domain-containing protein n=1 Tax=Microctonus hyperodae TaxID=165561 RepID=A0AA39L0D9_MICHY|nr:hypothetical protein PV327_005970 [Microctonus hyperodae]